MPSIVDRLVRELCDDFASADTAEEAAFSATYWIRETLNSPDAPVRVSGTDRAGRLRVIAETGHHPSEGRPRSARRREAFDSRIVKIWDLPSEPGTAFAFIPAVSRKESLGVVEVVAPAEALAAHLDLLLAVAAQTAGVLRSVRHRAELERLAGALSGVAQLTIELLRAETPDGAARAAIRFVGTQLALPVAAWAGTPDDPAMRFVGVRNVSGALRADLRRQIASVERGRIACERAMSTFGRVVREPVRDVNAESVLLFVGGATHATAELLRIVQSLLRKTVRVALPMESLDIGLAWTAHEVRQPLLGARATLQALSVRDPEDPRSRELLHRASVELGEAAQMVEGLLRGAAGVEPISRKPTNLMALVRHSAAAACAVESDRERLRIEGNPDVIVLADVPHLRTAFGNLFRNALSYSPPDSPVKIHVLGTSASAIVSVRDEGPGVATGEAGAIFGPLVRGSAGNRVHGSGLGLYITRRVVEAHGGAIAVRSNGTGATFSITLPAATDTVMPAAGLT